jgi:hypothetical protein
MSDPRAVGRVLTRCLQVAGAPTPPDLADSLRGVDLDQLVDEGVGQRVAGALLTTLASVPSLPQGPIDRLREATTANVVWQLALEQRMRTVTGALREAGIAHVVVKGPVLADHVYPDATWRAFADLDVLVCSYDAAGARRAIEDLGARVPSFQRRITESGLDGEIALFFDDGVNIDLHHEVVNDADVRSHFRIPVAEMVHRARSVTINGSAVPILDATDQVLHLCIHAAVSNGRKLVWLLDIDQAWRRDPPDLERLVERANRWDVGLPTAIMLERARRILRTPVDDELLDELAANGAWRRLCHAMLALRPPETSSGAVLSGGVVVACTRESTRASAAALARAVWREGVREPLRNADHPWRRRLRVGAGA